MKNNRKGINKVMACMTLFACIALSLPVQAEKVDADKAGKLAQRYVQSKRKLPAGDVVRLKYTAARKHQMKKASVTQPDDVAALDVQDTVFYYVFDVNENMGGGFVIVSGDDAVTPVLGFSDHGTYDENNLPPNFEYWMDYLQQEIRWAIAHQLPQSEAVRQQWDDYLNGSVSAAASVSPLLSTRWGQREPYWNMCPQYSGKNCVTGCTVTAMAQIMNYHRHPTRGTGQSTAYNSEKNGVSLSMPSVSFTVNYDWNNMLNSYSDGATTQQQNAVATLMYHCGVSVKMNYTPDESGAHTQKVPGALTSFFGYDKGIQFKLRAHYDDVSWDAMLREQIDAGLPVQYAGYGSGGHAFVCDGYNGDMFHFNWGWDGKSDGDFVTTALTPGTGNNFSKDQEIVINIKPDAGGVSTGYEIGLFDEFTSTATSVQGNESFTVSAKIQNISWEEFSGGKLGVAVVNQNDQIVEIVGTTTIWSMPLASYYPDPFSITCRVPNTVAQGQYKLRAVTQQTGGNWKIIMLSANCPNFIDFRVGPVIAVTGVTLNKTTTTIVAGATEQLTAMVLPANASNRNVEWSSNNPAAVTVSSNGLVTGIAAGTATITVKTQDGGKTDYCVVTVTPAGSGNCTVSSFPHQEGFENNGANLPSCWKQELVTGNTDWTITTTGNGTNDMAHGGRYMARLYKAGMSNTSRLIMPALNLSGLTNPTLKFWHTQEEWLLDQDILRIFFKTSSDGAWTLLKEYLTDITDWTERTIALPNASADYYIAFEGETHYGYGIQLDDILIDGDPKTFDPPVNVTAKAVNNHAEVTWEKPEASEIPEINKWIKYCVNDVIAGRLGSSQESADMTVAMRFTPSDLASLGVVSGHIISKIALGIGTNMNAVTSMEIKIWEGGTSVANPGTLVYSQPITGYASFPENAMREINLTAPYVIDATKELRIGWRVVLNTSGYPFGRDAGPAVPQKGILYTSGTSGNWSCLNTNDPARYNYNFSLKAWVCNESNPAVPERYAVYRLTEGQPETAWTLLSAQVAGTDFTDQGWSALSSGNYQYAVKAGYTGNNMSTAVLSNILHKASDQFAVTYSMPVNGTLSVMAGGSPVASGTMVNTGTVLTITATPNANYYLKTLTVNGYHFTSGGAHTVTSATQIETAFAYSNANLISLIPSAGTLNPVFHANVTNYTVIVPYTVESLNMTAITEDELATVAGDGAYSLNEGNNNIFVMVTAPDRVTQKTYSIVVIRQAPKSSDASLANILVNNHPAYPKPDNATVWEITMDYTTGITIAATPNHPEARVQESHQGAKSVKTGMNDFDIMVTAENGNRVNYVLLVTVKDLPNGINEHTRQPLTAYPNPARDRITIGGLESGGILTVSDAAGRLWMQRNIASSEETIDTGSLSGGIYMVQIIEGKSARTVKIIIE